MLVLSKSVSTESSWAEMGKAISSGSAFWASPASPCPSMPALFFLLLFSCSVVSDSFCDPMDSRPVGSSVQEISQVRILQWVGIPPPRALFLTQGSNPRLLHWQVSSLPLHHSYSNSVLTPHPPPSPLFFLTFWCFPYSVPFFPSFSAFLSDGPLPFLVSQFLVSLFLVQSLKYSMEKECIFNLPIK